MSPERKHVANQKESKKKLPPPVSIVRDILITNETSASGRPLGEREAVSHYPESHVHFKGSTETITCPYHDSRKGKQMNYPAFESMADNWQQVMDGLAWVRETYVGTTKNPRISLLDLGAMAALAESLPSYGFNKGKSPFRRYNDLPENVAHMHKAARGLHIVPSVLARREEKGLDNILPNEAMIYEFADKEGLLVGLEEVCAAPPRVIEQVTKVLLTGEKGDPDRSSLNKLFPDRDNLMEFSFLYSSVKQNLRPLVHESVFLTNNLVDSYYDRQIGTRESFDILDALSEYHVFEDIVLAQLSPLQPKMNRILGRQSDGRPPVINDLKALLVHDPFEVAERLGMDRQLLKSIRSRKISR